MTTASAKPGWGQWALGHREPLNANERAEEGPATRSTCGRRIENIYAKQGFIGIDRADLRALSLVGPVHPA